MEPLALLTTQSKADPLSAYEALLMVIVGESTPVITDPVPVGAFAKFTPFLRHWYVRGMVELAATEKVAVAEGKTDAGAGCCVIAGGAGTATRVMFTESMSVYRPTLPFWARYVKTSESFEPRTIEGNDSVCGTGHPLVTTVEYRSVVCPLPTLRLAIAYSIGCVAPCSH